MTALLWNGQISAWTACLTGHHCSYGRWVLQLDCCIIKSEIGCVANGETRELAVSLASFICFMTLLLKKSFWQILEFLQIRCVY